MNQDNNNNSSFRRTNLPTVDENSDEVKNDSLLQSIIKCRDLAKKHHLLELHLILSHAVPSFAGTTRKLVECQRQCYTSLMPSGSFKEKEVKSWSSNKMRLVFKDTMLELEVYLDPTTNNNQNGSDKTVDAEQRILGILGPKSNFDIQHEMESVKDNVLSKMRMKSSDDPTSIQRDFEKGNPIQNNLTNNRLCPLVLYFFEPKKYKTIRLAQI